MQRPLSTIVNFLQDFAPLSLAESWDNVGLLLGETEQPVHRIMTCLTLTPDVADEAVQKNADLIVSHHPILFRPVQKLTSQTSEGRMLLKLIQSRIAVYSPHTAFDSARDGINQQLAIGLQLTDIKPLRPAPLEEQPDVGGGRWGTLPEPCSVAELVDRVRALLGIEQIPVVADLSKKVTRVAVACGAAGEFLTDAVKAGCDAFLTGETRFHTCLDARDTDIAMLLPGHYATERPGIERLSALLQEQFPDVKVWPSEVERDPICFPRLLSSGAIQ